MTIQKIFLSLITVCCINSYVPSAYTKTTREVVTVSEKKHILPEHVKGLDTYNHPVDYFVPESYILRFKDRNGFFTVSEEVYNNTNLGDKFTTEDNQLYYCRREDECY